MSLQAKWNMGIPTDTSQIGRQILAKNDPYRLIGEGVNDFLSEEDFSSLYSELGRGAICPIRLSLVTVFQYLENLPDREAARRAVTGIDWKYALHVPLTWKGFHFSDLSNFRHRLLKHKAERLIFDKVMQWVRGLGFAKKHGKQRSDSSHVLGCVERLSRLELAWETLRVALRSIKAEASEWYEQSIPSVFDEAYVERQSDWRLSKEQAMAEMHKAGSDGFWLLEQVEHNAPQEVQELSQIATLRSVWEQQFERVEDSRKVAVRQPPIKGTEIIQSPHESEVRWAEKRGQDWVGYKLQVSETAEEGEARFITDIDIVAANYGDSQALGEIQERLIERDLQPDEHFVDRGYVSGPNLAHSAQRGIELVGPALADTSRKPQGYKQCDFEIDFETCQATCPQGQTSQAWRPFREASGQTRIEVFFGSHCQHCPARAACAPGKQGRKLSISPYYHFLSQRRAEQETQTFQERLKRRAGIEGTISELVRKHGARRARYRGSVKVRLQMLFTGTAANLKRLARALQVQRQVTLSTTALC